jgi:hypothetical protein
VEHGHAAGPAVVAQQAARLVAQGHHQQVVAALQFGISVGNALGSDTIPRAYLRCCRSSNNNQIDMTFLTKIGGAAGEYIYFFGKKFVNKPFLGQKIY